MKKSNVKLIIAIALVVALALSFSVSAFATAIYDCNEMGHIWCTDEAGEYILNEHGEMVCVACGLTPDEATDTSDTTVEIHADRGFTAIAILIGVLLLPTLLLLPLFLLLLPVLLLLLPVFILLAPLFVIIGLAISAIFMSIA